MAEVRPFPATLLRVVDADTLQVSADVGFGLSLWVCVRLVGVDAPELPTPAGLAAKAWVESVAKVGDRVTLVTDCRRDKYGRVLGTVVAGSTDINAGLLSNGHAKPYGG